MDHQTVKPFCLDLTKNEIEEMQGALADILKSGDVILGRYTEEFEREFAEYVGCTHAVTLNSGTSALETLLRINEAQGKLIAVPTNTNFATPAAIIRAGATPVFLDMTQETFMPDLQILQRALRNTECSGVVWVHIGGLISPDFLNISEFCRENGLFLIEDAAHAHGSRMAGRHAGTFGDGGAFSFFPTKVMTTMEGGMITTNSDHVAELARSYRNQGKKADRKFGSDHFVLGNSWRMLEVSAAMGLIQLRKLEEMLLRRKRVVAALKYVLDEIGVPFCDSAHMDSTSNYKLIIRHKETETIESIKQRFLDAGVILGGGVYERPCHLQPIFAELQTASQKFPIAEDLCPKHICPPVTSGMTDSDIDKVQQALRKCLIEA